MLDYTDLSLIAPLTDMILKNYEDQKHQIKGPPYTWENLHTPGKSSAYKPKLLHYLTIWISSMSL